MGGLLKKKSFLKQGIWPFSASKGDVLDIILCAVIVLQCTWGGEGRVGAECSRSPSITVKLFIAGFGLIYFRGYYVLRNFLF